jgi:transposase
MTNRFSLRQFKRAYGTHLQCLEAIKRLRFPDGTNCPKCENPTIFYPVKGRTAYACKWCGYHIYPLANTVFEKSTTPLDLWFFAMYLMVQTRSGISAKQLERMLGVTYKTAWRMFKQIRLLMAESGGGMLDGVVEIDETYVGGKGKNRKNEWRDQTTAPKEIVMGMVQRKGKVYMKHIQNTDRWTLINQVREKVSPTAKIYTDELTSYATLPQFGYFHETVNHFKSEYARGEVSTQNMENIWSHLKRGIFGVYRKVSPKYLQSYTNEFSWRYNNRHLEGGMFDKLLRQVTTTIAVKAS